MNKALSVLIGIVILIGWVYVVWKFKWIILGASVIVGIAEVVYERFTGKHTKWYQWIESR